MSLTIGMQGGGETICAHTPEWSGAEWAARVDVREGVYQRAGYPVTVTYLGPGPAGAAETRRQVVEALVRVHLRKGALAPGGMLVNWRHTQDGAFGQDGLDTVRPLMAALGPQLALMSHGYGHGYYLPRQPREPRIRA